MQTLKPLKSRWTLRAIGMVIATIGLTALTSQTASADTWRIPHLERGCPAYAVCFYPPNTGWNHNHPTFYYNFQAQTGVHYNSNLHGVKGTYRVFNNGVDKNTCNGSDREPMSLNTGYDGGGTHRWIEPGESFDVYLTPINSISLWHTERTGGTCTQ